MIKNAIFSPDRKYRYELTRTWGTGRLLGFTLLNGSTADEDHDDPTVRRCISFGQAWGYDGIWITNLQALATMDPKKLRAADDPTGPDNDRFLTRQSVLCHKVIVGWGNHGAEYPERVAAVLEILTNCRDVYCLGITKTGHPRHPLYVKMMPERELQLYSLFRGKVN
jgi:hypothetical protein